MKVIEDFYVYMKSLEKNRSISLTKEEFTSRYSSIFNQLKKKGIETKSLTDCSLIFVYKDKEFEINPYWVFLSDVKTIENFIKNESNN